jgi:hypothetical protein
MHWTHDRAQVCSGDTASPTSQVLTNSKDGRMGSPMTGTNAPAYTDAFTIDVAGVTMSARAGSDDVVLKVLAPLDRFIVDTQSPDVRLTVHYAAPPEADENDQEVFDSAGVWRLYRTGTGYTYAMSSPIIDGGRPYRVALFDEALSQGDLYIRPLPYMDEKRGADGRLPIGPWEYPLDELLVVNKIADGRGVDIHGCAIAREGVGHLFIGVSGAGKSTLAELWRPRAVRVLSDDRVIVRRLGDEMIGYGTPWHGDAGAALPDGVPLKGLYFLNQSRANYLRPISRADAVTRLVVRCFPTFYFRTGMENTLSLLSEIAASVPAYEFGFRNDQSAIDHLITSWE